MKDFSRKQIKLMKEQKKNYQYIYDELVSICEGWSPKFASYKQAFDDSLEIRDRLMESAQHIKSMYLAPDKDEVLLLCEKIKGHIENLKGYCKLYHGMQDAKETAIKIEQEIQNIFKTIMK